MNFSKEQRKGLTMLIAAVSAISILFIIPKILDYRIIDTRYKIEKIEK
ncbi:MAG: hypothetical protein WBP82_10850 [Leuconostoc mesenteroides]